MGSMEDSEREMEFHMSENVSNTAAASILVLLLTAALALIISRRNRSIERDRKLAELWDWMQQQDAPPAQNLIRIARVYQNAKRGSKAIIVYSDGRQIDTWFEGWHPAPGAYAVLRGHVGYGPHNRNSHVLYVRPGEVIGTAPADAPEASRRHQARLEKSAT